MRNGQENGTHTRLSHRRLHILRGLRAIALCTCLLSLILGIQLELGLRQLGDHDSRWAFELIEASVHAFHCVLTVVLIALESRFSFSTLSKVEFFSFIFSGFVIYHNLCTHHRLWWYLDSTRCSISSMAVGVHLLCFVDSLTTLIFDDDGDDDDKVAKKTAQKSKTLLTHIERMQKGVASTDVFGVAIGITVQQQKSTRHVPSILVKCANHLALSGLNSQRLFKSEGERKTIQQLVSLYNEDPSAALPEGVNPRDVAALIMCYLASLPEPLITFQLYDEIKVSRSSIPNMQNTLKNRPTANYMTLELITELLLRVSQEFPVNEMDAQSLAKEMSPIIMWKQGRSPQYYKQFWSSLPKNNSMTNSDSNYSALNRIADEAENVDGLPVDYGAIEVLQCPIEHHNEIFTDAHSDDLAVTNQ